MEHDVSEVKKLRYLKDPLFHHRVNTIAEGVLFTIEETDKKFAVYEKVQLTGNHAQVSLQEFRVDNLRRFLIEVLEL